MLPNPLVVRKACQGPIGIDLTREKSDAPMEKAAMPMKAFMMIFT